MTAHDAVVVPVPSGRNLDVELNRPDRKRTVSTQIKDEEIVAALQNKLVAAINEDNAKKLKTGQNAADDGGNDKKRMKRTHPNAPEHIQIDRSHVQPDASITSGLKTPIFDSAADRSGSLQSASTDSNSSITDPVSASSTSSSAHPSSTRPPSSSLKRELTPTSVPLPTPQPQQSSHVRRPSLKRESSISSSSLSVSQPPQPLYYYPSCGLSPSEWSPIFNFSSVLSSSSYPSIPTTSDSEKLQLKTLNLPVAPTGSKLLLEKEYDIKGVFPKSIHTVIKDIPKCIEFEYPERNKMMSELRGMGMSAYVEIQDVAKSQAVTYLILSPFEVKPQEYRIAGYIVDSQLILERINRRVQRLLSRNMLPLVLDLDDTLVRVVGDQGNGARFVDDKDTGQYDDRMRLLPDGRKVVLTRGVHEFLNWCKDKFEVSICSLGDPTYVNAIKQILDPKGDTIQGIVYSARQEFDYLLYLTQLVHKKDTHIPPTPSVAVPPPSTTAVTSPPPTPISEVPPAKSKITVSLEIPPKNLDALFPFCHVKDPHFQGHGYTLPLILDDRIDTWPVQQQNNVILVQESSSSQPWNVNLHHIQPILAEIHSTFFSQYDKYRRKQQWGGYAGRIRSATVLEGKMRTAHVPDVRDVLGLYLRRMLAEKVANGDAHAKNGKREVEEGEVKTEDGEIGGDVSLKSEPQTSSPFPSQSQLFLKSRGQQYPTATSKFPNRNPGPGQPHKRKKKRNRDRHGGPDSRSQLSRPDTSSNPPSLSSSSSQLPGLHRHESRSRSTSQSEVGVSRSGTSSRNPSRESSLPNVPSEKESVVTSSDSKEVKEETPLPGNTVDEQDTASVQSTENRSKVDKDLVGETISAPVAVNVENNSTSIPTGKEVERNNTRPDFMMTEPIVEKKEKIEIEARVDTGLQKPNAWGAGGVKYAEVKVEREVLASDVNPNRYQDRNVWSDGSTHHRVTVEPKREFPLFPNTADRRASSTERLLEIQSSASTVQQPHHPETVNRGHGYQPHQSTQPGLLSQRSSRQMSPVPPPPASLWHDSKPTSQYRSTPVDQPAAGSVSSQYHQTRDFRRPSTDYGYSSQHPSSYQTNQSQVKVPSSSTDWSSYYPPSSSSMSSSTQPSQSRSSRPYLPPPASLDSIINQPIPTKPSPMPPYSQSSSSVNYGVHPLTDRERERERNSLPLPSSYSFSSSRTPVSNAHAQPSSNHSSYIPLHQQNQSSHISLPSRSQHASSTPVNTNVQSHRPSAGYTQSQYDQRTQYTDNRYQSSYPPPPTQQQQQQQQQQHHQHSPHHRPIDNQADQNNYRQPQHNQQLQYPPQQNQNQQNHGTSYQYYNYQR